MTSETEDSTRKQSIARLVSQGKMTHEYPGQYISEDVDDTSRNAIPTYDIDVLTEALPQMLQLDFDEDDENGCWMMLEDGTTGTTSKVMLGKDPPETTAGLIKVIQAHYRDEIGLAGMDETADAFAAFDDMED